MLTVEIIIVAGTLEGMQHVLVQILETQMAMFHAQPTETPIAM